MPVPRCKTGLLHYGDGRVAPARLYYGDGEADPPSRVHVDPEHYATWVEGDGAVGIRRGKSASIGATAAYAANYDTLDWGN